MVVVMMLGCGPSPLPGAPKLDTACSPTTDKIECYSESSFAFCDSMSGRWDEYACADRCSGGQCKIRQVIGEACPRSWEGFFFCSTDTERAACLSGKWTAERACPDGCTEANGGVTCR